MRTAITFILTLALVSPSLPTGQKKPEAPAPFPTLCDDFREEGKRLWPIYSKRVYQQSRKGLEVNLSPSEVGWARDYLSFSCEDSSGLKRYAEWVMAKFDMALADA